MKRHYQWAGLLILFLLLAVLKGPEFFQNGRTNQWAIHVSRLCLSTDINKFAGDATLADTGVNTQMSWLTGQRAHCQQKENEATLAWRRTLEMSSERLSLVRAAAPHNLTLAQFATAQYPDQAEPFFWLGDAYVAAAQTTQATQAFETGLSLQPEHNPLAWIALGRLYEASDDWQGAVRAYDEACFHHEGDRGKNGCPNAGRLYLAWSQYELAESRYRMAIMQIPTFYRPAVFGLAQALLAQGKNSEAQPYLRDLAERGDSEAQLLLDQLTNSNSD